MADLADFKTYLPSNALSDTYLQQVLDDASSQVALDADDVNYDRAHRAYAAHLLVVRGRLGVESSISAGGVSKSFQRPSYRGSETPYLMEYASFVASNQVKVIT